MSGQLPTGHGTHERGYGNGNAEHVGPERDGYGRAPTEPGTEQRTSGPGHWLRGHRFLVIAVSLGLAGALVVVGFLITGSSHGGSAGQGSPNAAGATTNSNESGSTSAATAAASGSAGNSATAGPTTATGPVSLSGWKLTLPVDSSGSLSGNAKQLSTAAVTAPWLTRNADGSLSFWAPATGATTPNSQHARTELVSANDFSFGSASHTLSAQVAVTQVPTGDPDICLGQIHGGGSISSVPFVMLHWRNGSIVVVVKKVVQGSSSQTVTLLTGVPLGATFSFTLSDEGNGSIGLSAAYEGRSEQASVTAAAAFLDTDQRFQVGDYQQAVSGSSASDGGRATFYRIQQN